MSEGPIRRVSRRVWGRLRRRRFDRNGRRIEMTCGCRDADPVPKVAGAGEVFVHGGRSVQRMHQGILVPAGGYYGDWMTEIIRRLRGHHEPQEELLFHHLLTHCRPGTRIVEIGAFWAYYSAWFLAAVPGGSAVCLEPDATYAACGRETMALNGLSATWVEGLAGRTHRPETPFVRESDGRSVPLPVHSLASLLDVAGPGAVELLHVDAQGAELPFLESLADDAVRGLVRFVVVSTHHESISGSPTTHEDCRRAIGRLGGTILAEHAVEESFSGDGLIVASLHPDDDQLVLPGISRNTAAASLFGAPQPFRSRAQNLEDIVLWRALGRVRGGRYVDIGACDPHFLSVSRGFYEQGWRGVHFEPLPRHAASLRADRPDETVHEIALADHCGEIDFFVSSVEGNSSGIAAYASPGTPAVKVPVRSLASFGSGWAGDEVHWMKIDVEGMEGEVLRGWDPRLLRPWILVVEATRPNSTQPSHEAWEPIVLAGGYRFALFDGLNRFYVADEHAELVPVVAAPANVFDLMQGCRAEAWRAFTQPPGGETGPPSLSARLRRLAGRFLRPFRRRSTAGGAGRA